MKRRIYEVLCWFQLVHTGCPTLWGDNQSELNCAKQVSVTDNQSGTSHSVTCSDYLCHTSVNLSNSWIWNSSELHQFLQVLRCNEIRPKSQGDIFYFCIFVFEFILAFSFLMDSRRHFYMFILSFSIESRRQLGVQLIQKLFDSRCICVFKYLCVLVFSYFHFELRFWGRWVHSLDPRTPMRVSANFQRNFQSLKNSNWFSFQSRFSSDHIVQADDMFRHNWRGLFHQLPSSLLDNQQEVH